MIFTERKITISKNTSSIDKQIVLYRGDKNVEIRFTISEFPFKYSRNNETNVIESTEASFGQLVIKVPNDKTPIFSDIVSTKKGAVVFTITGEMIDEISEIGTYDFQIRLFDEEQNSRATIPPIEKGIEIREPIATEDISNTNEVGVATVGYALTTSSETLDAFDENGNYIKTAWSTGDRITAAKLDKIEVGIDRVNSQIKEVKNYSLVKHTDGLLYIKKQDGTLIGTGVEVGSDSADLSTLTMSITGQTLKLLDGTTELATVEIPTAVVTDEQLTSIIQSKIDDGTLSSIALGDDSVSTSNIVDGAITPSKTNFFNETIVNLAYGLTWINTGFGGDYNPPYGNNQRITPLIKVDKNYIYTKSPKMVSAFTQDSYHAVVGCYDSNQSYLGTATISASSNINGTADNPGHKWLAEYTLLDNTAYIRYGLSNSHGLNYTLTADNLALAIISYEPISDNQDPSMKLFGVSPDYLQYLIDAILIEKSVTGVKLSDTAIKEQFEGNDINTSSINKNNNNIIDFYHTKFFTQKEGKTNLFNGKLPILGTTNPIDSTVNNDDYGFDNMVSDLIDTGSFNSLCIGVCSTVESSETNLTHLISGVFCFGTNGKYLGKGTIEFVDSMENKDESDNYISRYLRFRVSNFIEGTSYIRVGFTHTWINKQDVLDTCIVRPTLPDFNENAKLITIKVADNYKLEGIQGSASVSQDSSLAGKNVVWIGDSLTDWGGGGYGSPGEGFLGIVYQNTGAITYNQGTAGASWEYGFGTWDETHTTYTPTEDEQYSAIGRVATLVANKDTFTPDYVVFMMGTNRRNTGTAADEYTNLHTMCGAIKHCILQIYNNFPECAIGIVLPPQRQEGMAEQEQANSLIKEIAEYYSVPTIDLFHEGGLLNKYRNPLTNTSNSGGFSDGLHLSDLGKKILGRKFTHWLKTL